MSSSIVTGDSPGSTAGDVDAPTIGDLLDDAAVLVTGGTGFVGGVLVEKLLRSCPRLARVYLLVRSRRGLDGQARVKQLLDRPVREKHRQQRDLNPRQHASRSAHGLILCPSCGSCSRA